MNVILLTVFLGLILVGLALVLFFYISATSGRSSPEQDSLMPLDDDEVRTPKKCQVCLKKLETGLQVKFRQFMLASIIWGLVAMCVGVLIALQLNYKFLNFNMEWLTFGRLRPLHTNAATFVPNCGSDTNWSGSLEIRPASIH